LSGLAVAGVTSPVWFPALKNAVDGNEPKIPDANNGDMNMGDTKAAAKLAKLTGKRELKDGMITRQGFKEYNLNAHVTPADANDGSKIDQKSFLLYKSADISDAGAKEVTNKGTWKVSNTGLLSYEPDNTLEFGKAEIYYSVKDQSDRQSNRAIINIQYGPSAATIEKFDLAPDKKTAAISISQSVTLGSELTTLDGSIWKVENGKVTFEPSDGFISTMVSIGYQVKDKSGGISNEAPIVLSFKSKSMVKPSDGQPGATGKPLLGFMPNIAVNTKNVRFSISTTESLAASSVEIAAAMAGQRVQRMSCRMFIRLHWQSILAQRQLTSFIQAFVLLLMCLKMTVLHIHSRIIS